jgi:cyclohexanone monooxygenase
MVETADGARVSARFCILATGCLSLTNIPKFKGLETFTGDRYHTGRWPHENVDFTGRRVGIIGTGSSGIQLIPLIASQAEHLFVFQRTPNYTIPAHNAPMDPEDRQRIKANYATIRAEAKQLPGGSYSFFGLNPKSALEVTSDERQREYERWWAFGGGKFILAFADLLANKEANDTAAEFVRSKIRETVNDPKVAELLSPQDLIGGKRLCVDTDYWATFNRSNVTLIDVSQQPIETFTRKGIKVSGVEYEIDAIVFATGFDAMTGALTDIDIRGRGGVMLRERWADGPRTYLGLGVAGFPNFFTITGPGSPSVLSMMIGSIERHSEWIADCLKYMSERGIGQIEPSLEAEDDWCKHVAAVAATSLRATCGSWYLGANIPGKPRVFMPYLGGVPAYTRKCDDVAANAYEGFVLS